MEEILRKSCKEARFKRNREKGHKKTERAESNPFGNFFGKRRGFPVYEIELSC